MGSDPSVSLFDVLAHAGLMNDRLGVVHGVWLSPRNIAQIAEAGARVVHNPISNLKLKSGVAPGRIGRIEGSGATNCTIICNGDKSLPPEAADRAPPTATSYGLARQPPPSGRHMR
jgi:hypothetical protein